MEKTILYILTIILASILFWGFISTESLPDTSADVTEKVLLYSNGNLINEWEGVGRGQLEGDTYIFKTERGQFSRIIRIRGDFVVETLPN